MQAVLTTIGPAAIIAAAVIAWRISVHRATFAFITETRKKTGRETTWVNFERLARKWA